MRVRTFLGVALIATIAGCSASESPMGVELLRLGEQSNMDCQLSQARCDVIQAGIDYLKTHANATCRVTGDNAQSRYDSQSGDGYREEPDFGGYDMSVYTVSPTNPAPADGYVNVYPRFWTSGNTDATATGALLAHEEAHHLSMSESAALQYQSMCLNPQP